MTNQLWMIFGDRRSPDVIDEMECYESALISYSLSVTDSQQELPGSFTFHSSAARYDSMEVIRVLTVRPWFLALLFFSGFLALRLSQLQDIFVRQSWSKTSCRLAFPLRIVASRQDYGRLGCNRSISRDAVRLGGLLYTVGISTHANSRIQFEPVPPTVKSGYFTGVVGLSDHVVYVGGSAAASIHINGLERWRSRRLVPGVVDSFRVPVASGDSIELMVGDAGDDIRSDEVAWVQLRIQ